MGRPSKYTEEFRRDAVELVRSSGRPINEVNRLLTQFREMQKMMKKAASGGRQGMMPFGMR